MRVRTLGIEYIKSFVVELEQLKTKVSPDKTTFLQQIDAVINMLRLVIASKSPTILGFMANLITKVSDFRKFSLVMNGGDGTWSVKIEDDKRLAELVRDFLNQFLANWDAYTEGNSKPRIPVLMQSEIDVKKIIIASIRSINTNIAIFDSREACQSEAGIEFVKARQALSLSDVYEQLEKLPCDYSEEFIDDLLNRFENYLKKGKLLPTYILVKSPNSGYDIENFVNLKYLESLALFLLNAAKPLSMVRRQQLMDVVSVSDVKVKKLKQDLETFCQSSNVFLSQPHSPTNLRIIRELRDEVQRYLLLLLTPDKMEEIKKYYDEEYRELHRLQLLAEETLHQSRGADALVVHNKYQALNEQYKSIIKKYCREKLGFSEEKINAELGQWFKTASFHQFFYGSHFVRSADRDSLMFQYIFKPPIRVVTDLLMFVSKKNQEHVSISKAGGGFSFSPTVELISSLQDLLFVAFSTFTIEDDLMTSLRISTTLSVTPAMRAPQPSPASDISTVSQIALAGGSPLAYDFRAESPDISPGQGAHFAPPPWYANTNQTKR